MGDVVQAADMKAPGKSLFEPKVPEELLRGWLLHSHKGRDRHDEAARRLDRYRYFIGVPATLFAAVAGTSVLATWQQESPSQALTLFAGIVGITAAVLASLQTFLDFGSRAEQHRVVGARYKAIIREIERRTNHLPNQLAESPLSTLQSALPLEHKSSEHKPEVQDTASIREPTQTIERADSDALAEKAGDWLLDLESRLDLLEQEAPVVPIPVFNRIQRRYKGARFVESAEQLNS